MNQAETTIIFRAKTLGKTNKNSGKMKLSELVQIFQNEIDTNQASGYEPEVPISTPEVPISFEAATIGRAAGEKIRNELKQYRIQDPEHLLGKTKLLLLRDPFFIFRNFEN